MSQTSNSVVTGKAVLVCINSSYIIVVYIDFIHEYMTNQTGVLLFV